MVLQETKTRDSCVDWCRFIGISLVVIGHAGCPTLIKDYLYLFHMALFFFLSGYCYNNYNDQHFYKYVIKKVRTIYIPYIVYNGIFVLLHNAFLRLNLYTSDIRFLTLEYGNEYGIMIEYSFHETVEQLIRTLLFASDEEMGGATWFLRILFVVCIFHCLLGVLTDKLLMRSYRNIICYSIGGVFLIIGWIFDAKSIHLPLELQTVFSAYFPFALGVLWKNRISDLIQKIRFFLRIILCFACAAVLLIMCKNHSIVLGLNRIVNPLFYGVATILGCIQVFLISRISSDLILTEMVNKVVSAIAKNSLYIVFFHFLSFKIVTYVYVKILGLPQLYLASFPVLFRKGSWIAYTIIGICIPVLLGLAIHKLQTILNDTRNNRPSKTTSNERL